MKMNINVGLITLPRAEKILMWLNFLIINDNPGSGG
jgi:hypothetical protein